MIISHVKFEPIRWEYDPSVFTKQEYMEILVYPEFNSQEGIRFLNDRNLPFAQLVFKWTFHFKKIFFLEADDYYNVNLSDGVFDLKYVQNIITDSYSRFSQHFDRLKAEVGLQYSLPLVQSTYLEIMGQRITDKLKNKS